jgi:hypothetical protein
VDSFAIRLLLELDHTFFCSEVNVLAVLGVSRMILKLSPTIDAMYVFKMFFYIKVYDFIRVFAVTLFSCIKGLHRSMGIEVQDG